MYNHITMLLPIYFSLLYNTPSLIATHGFHCETNIPRLAAQSHAYFPFHNLIYLQRSEEEVLPTWNILAIFSNHVAFLKGQLFVPFKKNIAEVHCAAKKSPPLHHTEVN